MARPFRLVASVIALVAFAGASALAESAPSGPVDREIQRLGHGSSSRVSAPVGTATRAGSRVPAPETSADLFTADADAWAGSENAIYAADRKTVYVAYKKFLRSPFDPGGDLVPAELRVAKSTDGGKTWSVDVLTDRAREEGDVIQQSVVIGGHGAKTVYVAYLVQLQSGDKLRIAKTADGGATWSFRTLVTGGGVFKAIRVLDAKTVLLAVGLGCCGSAELRLFRTTDGGAHWSSRRVDVGTDWYVGLDSTPRGRVWMNFYEAGTTDLHAVTGPSPSGPWTQQRIAGNGTDAAFTGLWGTTDVQRGDVYTAYEDFRPAVGKSLVRLLRSTDGGDTWKQTSVDSAFAIGWQVSVEARDERATGLRHVFMTYWFEWVNPPTYFGRVRIAHSTDGGRSFEVWSIPDPEHVTPNIDLAVPAVHRQFVSYQGTDPDTGDRVLRVARLDLAA